MTKEQLEQVRKIASSSRTHAECCQRLIAAGFAKDEAEADAVLYELDDYLST